VQVSCVGGDDFAAEDSLLVQRGNGGAGLRGDKPELRGECVEFGGEQGGAQVGPKGLRLEVDRGVAGEGLGAFGVRSAELGRGVFFVEV